ncbi:MAG: 3-oxoacyl-[acyl-carrier protein] reductase [Natronomonas sp.]|jgi:3-oxoacyl-[acyl-carrier protein] reductase|uniref:SDR family NAD(P)-dependent oxidoreductase n=1 Tax=Natronomonas sp. TaxID=2184060 RepID=UPI0039E54D0F
MLEPDCEGRVALVTGSARGVGRAFVLALADAGADVAVHYNTSEAAAAATAEEAADRGVDSIAVGADVTDPDAVEGLFATVEESLGGVDILVNNVGDFAPQHWSDVDHDTWRRVLDTNLTATMLCSKRALESMRETEWGRIVNVGYASAERASVSAKNFPYFVAKTGVIMFTRMLAGDTQDDGVTVNAVSPYVVETSDAFPEEAPRGRWAHPDDLVQALLFFVDEDSGYISGENVEVDGGWLPESV